MKRIRWSGLALLALCALPRIAHATTYYVDDVGGNDSNSGTSPATAWRTLNRVNSQSQFYAGDEIRFRAGGTWTGQLRPKGNGTSTAPITIDRYGSGNAPKINGNGAGQRCSDQQVTAEGAIYLVDQSGWAIKNLEITNIGTPGCEVVGIKVRNTGAGGTIKSHIYIQNNYIHDVKGIVNGYYGANAAISITADMNLLNPCPTWPSACPPNPAIDNILIEGNTITSTDRIGIFIGPDWSPEQATRYNYPLLPNRMTNVTIRWNTLDDIGGDGILLTLTSGASVDGNIVSNSGTRIIDKRWEVSELSVAQVSASSSSGSYTAAKAVDHDLGTWWTPSTSDSYPWITVDLRNNLNQTGPHPVKIIRLTWGSSYATSYRIETSNDAISWSLLVNATSQNGGTDLWEVSRNARYVRISNIAKSGSAAVQLRDFRVYEDKADNWTCRPDQFLASTNCASAAIWTAFTSYATIQKNEVYNYAVPSTPGRENWDGMAFDSDLGTTNTTFQYNYSHDNWGGFIMMYEVCPTYPGGSLRQNNIRIRYNISYNDRTRIFHFGEGDPKCHPSGAGVTGFPSGPDPVDINNNLVIISAGQNVPMFGGTEIVGNAYIYNNIFYVLGQTSYPRFVGSAQFGNNVYFAPGYTGGTRPHNEPCFQGSIDCPSLDYWMIDTSKQISDPLLVSTPPSSAPIGIANLDFLRLSSGSPALGTGHAPGYGVDGTPNLGWNDFWGNATGLDPDPNRGPYNGPGL